MIKTMRRDLHSFVELQSDLIEFDFRRVLVSVPGQHARYFAPHVYSRYSLTTDEDTLEAFGHRHGLADSWYSQQLIKLLLVCLAEADASWVLDASTLLLHVPEVLLDTHACALELGDLCDDDMRWHHRSASFLGLPGRPEAAIRPVNQLLRRELVARMLGHVAHRYGDNPVRVLSRACVTGARSDFPLWTEYGRYGSFAGQLGAASGHTFLPARTRIEYYRRVRRV